MLMQWWVVNYEKITENLYKNQQSQNWTTSVIIPIYKKGDYKVCDNYRGISLMSMRSKIYERVLEKRLRREIKES